MNDTRISYNELIGIPYDEFGDSINGTNCYNLLRMAFKKHGLYIPETNIAVCACSQASNREIQDQALKYWTQIERPIEPCGVLIQSPNPMFSNHLGTYIGNDMMLHITQNTNSVVERLYPKFNNKILGFYQFRSEK